MSNLESNLKIEFNNDGTATLKTERYKHLDIYFDKSVVDHLRNIDQNKYFFVVYLGMENSIYNNKWQILERNSTNELGIDQVFLSGLIKKDGVKIICKKEALSLNLLENGIDFIIRGLDELYEVDDDIEYEQYIFPISKPQKDYKYGILHLFSGYLLILKYKLFLKSEQLIFNKNGHTLDYKNTLIKLETSLEPPVNFTPEQKKVVTNIQEYRNCFEHYQVIDLDVYDLNLKINDFIELIYTFLIEHLDLDIASNSFNTNPKTLLKICSILPIYEKIINKRKEEITRLGNEKVVKFKTVRESVLQKLKEESDYVDVETGDYGDYSDNFDICPKCDKDTLIIYGEFKGVCSNKKCYVYTPLKNCNKCEAIMKGYEWIEEWCFSCIEEMERIIERDD